MIAPRFSRCVFVYSAALMSRALDHRPMRLHRNSWNNYEPQPSPLVAAPDRASLVPPARTKLRAGRAAGLANVPSVACRVVFLVGREMPFEKGFRPVSQLTAVSKSK
jgi:hypothetical protein